ncbi:PadR family transcriptional regulator [Paenibacillus ehimensis]|uniref:PadR family transcriptional regulator n=1 Tax=Paenibacillus ehimensis TaxID=79264 RepID=UPI000FD7A417|nr:PadR family transcriptional regulator [Paenibacillus ehimensis]MEC0210922.1 PadR family transcriptional regulator [Paenibacillus ehimensis]
MKKSNTIQRSPVALAILALLAEEPMHPYRMQQLLKERGKDEVINVRQRTSIYQTIDRLLRDGLIAVRETLKEPGKPDRTVYESTEDGRKLFREWLRDMLSVPSQEFPDFPVAVSFLSLLTPDDVLKQLERRALLLEKEIQRVSSDLQTYKDILPRLFMLETEYKRAVLTAEWQWVCSVSDDLRNGELDWDEEWLREIALRLNSKE